MSDVNSVSDVSDASTLWHLDILYLNLCIVSGYCTGDLLADCCCWWCKRSCIWILYLLYLTSRYIKIFSASCFDIWVDWCLQLQPQALVLDFTLFDDRTLISGRLSLLRGLRWLSSHTSLLRLRYGLCCLPSDLQTLTASEPRYSVATWRLLWVFTASACAMLCCGFYFYSACFLSNERWTDRIIDALCISYLAPFCAKLCLTATIIAC